MCIRNIYLFSLCYQIQARSVLTENMTHGLPPVFAKVCEGLEIGLIGYNKEDDYVHLLLKYLSEVTLSKPVNGPKDVFDRLLRKDFLRIRDKLNKF